MVSNPASLTYVSCAVLVIYFVAVLPPWVDGTSGVRVRCKTLSNPCHLFLDEAVPSAYPLYAE